MDFGGVQVKRIHVSQCKLVCQEIMAMAKAGPQTILWVEKSLYYLLTPWKLPSSIWSKNFTFAYGKASSS